MGSARVVNPTTDTTEAGDTDTDAIGARTSDAAMPRLIQQQDLNN